MNRVKWFLPWLLALLALAPALARANDSSFGGSGSDLIPLQNTVILLQDEEVLLDATVQPNQWTVTATYHFQNPSAQTVSLQMGFPESRCASTEEVDCSGTGAFNHLQTTVRGAPVAQRTGNVSRAERHWSSRLGKVYLYEVTFAPHETVEIVHRYAYGRSDAIEGEEVYYLTTTGKLWSAPIGRARFTLRLDEHPWGVWYPRRFTVIAYQEKLTARGPQTELVLEIKNWLPSNDFGVTLYGRMASAVRWYGCPSAPIRDDEELSSDFSEATLRRCRNLPYARHGRPFERADLTKLFYDAKPNPRRIASLEDANGAYLGFRPNPFFDERLLDERDRDYIHSIDLRLARHSQ